MTCRQYKDLMMGYLDNELDEAQKFSFEQHVQSCKECAAEFEQFKKLKNVTDSVKFAEPEDVLWENYWSGVYNRFERGLGWLLMSVTGIALIIFGLFKLVEGIVKDPNVELILKIAILALLAGLAVMFVSILRERLYFWKKDRYKDVRR
ncbi:MAG: zf-HC2 domain-containing protein [Phycisphaerae bacterium]